MCLLVYIDTLSMYYCPLKTDGKFYKSLIIGVQVLLVSEGFFPLSQGVRVTGNYCVDVLRINKVTDTFYVFINVTSWREKFCQARLSLSIAKVE